MFPSLSALLLALCATHSHADTTVPVAVLDSGIDFNHAEVMGRLAPLSDNGAGSDLVENDGRPDDDTGHGTAVSRLVLEAPQATLIPVKVTDARSWSGGSRVAAGIRYAAAQGARIIVLSLSSPSTSFAATIEPALREADAAGILIIAAAGNQGSDLALQPRYPASFSLTNLITVGALSADGTPWPYSNFGTPVTAWAYGGEAGLAPDVAQHFGTSLAAPRIAAQAVASLVNL